MREHPAGAMLTVLLLATSLASTAACGDARSQSHEGSEDEVPRSLELPSGVVVPLPLGWRVLDAQSPREARSPDGFEYLRDDGTDPSILRFMIEVDTDPGYRRAEHPQGYMLYLRSGVEAYDYQVFVKLGQLGWTFACRERADRQPSVCLTMAQNARLATPR